MIKKILLGLILLFVLIQFIRPDKNNAETTEFDISTKYQIPNEVSNLLTVACNDCHTNKTTYPWYANVQPVAWWLNDHIEHGKGHLNFSKFTHMPIAIQNHKFDEIVETVEDHEMPLESYTYLGLHSEANLSEKQRKTIIQWAKTQMAYLKANYPADSLVMPSRR